MSSSNIDSEMLNIDQVSLDDPNPNAKAMKLFRYGQNLTENLIEPYENLLAQNETIDPGLGVLLLGYYYNQSNGSSADGSSASLLGRYADLLEWFIENHPSSFIIWTATYREDDDNFKRLKIAWLHQCSKPQTNVAILNNAAHFCARGGGDVLAEVFWKRAKKLSPSAIWPYELACLYKKQVIYAESAVQKKELAEKVLLEFMDMQARPNDYLEQSYLSPTLMQDAIKQFRQLAREFDLPFPEPQDQM